MRLPLVVVVFAVAACEAHTQRAQRAARQVGAGAGAAGPAAKPEQAGGATAPRAKDEAGEPLPSRSSPPATSEEAAQRLRKVATKMASVHFDDLFAVTAEALGELAPAIETLDCRRPPVARLAELRRTVRQFERSDALGHVMPARDALRLAVDALDTCGRATPEWIWAARDAVAAIDTGKTFELQHAPLQNAMRAVVDAFAASRAEAAPSAQR